MARMRSSARPSRRHSGPAFPSARQARAQCRRSWRAAHRERPACNARARPPEPSATRAAPRAPLTPRRRSRRRSQSAARRRPSRRWGDDFHAIRHGTSTRSARPRPASRLRCNPVAASATPGPRLRGASPRTPPPATRRASSVHRPRNRGWQARTRSPRRSHRCDISDRPAGSQWSRAR